MMESPSKLSKILPPFLAPIPWPEYLSVKEAARIIGVSERSVYGYIEKEKLAAFRFGNLIVVDAEAARNYRRQSSGRPRVRIPEWHISVADNSQSLTSITVRVYTGQIKALERKMTEIRSSGKHRIFGTIARYVLRSKVSLDEIHILLVWRLTVMPHEEERKAVIAALRDDFADILDWDTAKIEECQVLMHT